MGFSTFFCMFHDVFGSCNVMIAVFRLLFPIFLHLLASRELVGCTGVAWSAFIVYMRVFALLKMNRKKPKIFDVFARLITFLDVQLIRGCGSRNCAPMQYSCIQAGYAYPYGEGFTGPSRGKHWLTVYRAHASINSRWAQIFS